MRFRRPKFETTKSPAQRPALQSLQPKRELIKPAAPLPPTWGWGRFKDRVSALLHRDGRSSSPELPVTLDSPPDSPPGYPLGVLPSEEFFEKVATYEEEYRNVKVFWSIPEFQNPQLWDRNKLCQQACELSAVLSTLDWHKNAVEAALKALARCQPDSPSWSVGSAQTEASFPGSYPWSGANEVEYAPEPEPQARAAVIDYLHAHYAALSELRDDVSRWRAELLAVVDKV